MPGEMNHCTILCICFFVRLFRNLKISLFFFSLNLQKFHLPPDISETVSRSQVNNSSIKPGTPLCSATTPVNNLLDF